VSRAPIIAVAWPKDDYLSSIERAGGQARIVEPGRDAVASVLAECDGILLTGGADVDPAHYGDEDRHHTLSLEPERDTYELDLARGAMAADTPLLAICRGVQVLNVAAGGTLYQDLPSQTPSATNHRVTHSTSHIAHPVVVTTGSRLEGLVSVSDTNEMPVNSRHHQAIRSVAPGFVVSAVAPDGVIEGIEREGATFCIGVQWHPENFWVSGEFHSLFHGFVEAARRPRPEA